MGINAISGKADRSAVPAGVGLADNAAAAISSAGSRRVTPAMGFALEDSQRVPWLTGR